MHLTGLPQKPNVVKESKETDMRKKCNRSVAEVWRERERERETERERKREREREREREKERERKRERGEERERRQEHVTSFLLSLETHKTRNIDWLIKIVQCFNPRRRGCHHGRSCSESCFLKKKSYCGQWLLFQ